MITRHRRQVENQSIERTSSKLFLDGQTMSLDEFWDAMADEVEAMSRQDLRAELVPLKAHLANKTH